MSVALADVLEVFAAGALSISRNPGWPEDLPLTDCFKHGTRLAHRARREPSRETRSDQHPTTC